MPFVCCVKFILYNLLCLLSLSFLYIPTIIEHSWNKLIYNLYSLQNKIIWFSSLTDLKCLTSLVVLLFCSALSQGTFFFNIHSKFIELILIKTVYNTTTQLSQVLCNFLFIWLLCTCDDLRTGRNEFIWHHLLL